MEHSSEAVARPLLNRRRSVDYQSLTYHGWRCLVDREYSAPVIVDRFITVHDTIRRGEATVFQNSGGRAVAMIRVMIDGRPVPLLVKEDDVMRSGLRSLLKYLVRPSRARITWQRTIQLCAAGVAVQAPVALLEQRRWGLVYTSIYVGGYAPDAVPIAHAFRGIGGMVVDRTDLLTVLARELRTMHDGGFYHGDLKDGNILVERHPAGWAITLIDLENVRTKHPMTERARAIDLGRLWLALMPLTKPADLENFLDRYVAIAPRLDSVSLRQAVMERVDALQTRRFGGLSDISAQLKADITARPASLGRKHWVIMAVGSTTAALDAVPLLTVLRREFPSIRLELLATGETAAALAHYPDLRDIVTISARPGVGALMATIRLLRARHYHVAIDITDTIHSALLTRVTGAAVRIGYRVPSIATKWFKRITCYTHMIMARPEQRDRAQYYLLVAKALGLDTEIPAHRPDKDADRTPA